MAYTIAVAGKGGVGKTTLCGLLIQYLCSLDKGPVLAVDAFTVAAEGKIFLRSRQSGDEIRLSGGTKSLKKLFIDRKIPASQRNLIPVVCDDRGILGVWGIGANLDRVGSGVTITFTHTPNDRNK